MTDSNTEITRLGVWLTPLEYMLRVMNDGAASVARRDRMAVAAASYVHPKADIGKKMQAQLDAQSDGEGTDWEACSAAEDALKQRSPPGDAANVSPATCQLDAIVERLDRITHKDEQKAA